MLRSNPFLTGRSKYGDRGSATTDARFQRVSTLLRKRKTHVDRSKVPTTSRKVQFVVMPSDARAGMIVGLV